MVSQLSLRFSAAALFAFGLLPIQAADAPGSGDLWQVTTQMSMEGMTMQMPAQTSQVCAAKVWTRPPTDPNDPQKCTTTNFKVSGSKTTWETSCKGPPAMSGIGEVTRQGADAYSGTIKLTAAEVAMTIRVNGKRIGGCDNPS